MKTFVIITVIALFAAAIGLPRVKQYFSLGLAAVYVALGVTPLKTLPTVIDWNVLMMISGTMVLVYFFIESQVPNLMAEKLLDASPNVCALIVLMSVFSGFVSAFIDNTSTVIMLVPVALAVCQKLEISPIPMVISISVASNLEGAATLVGDTTSIMLGAHMNMSFMDFIVYKGKPSLFFAVQLGLLASVVVMLIIFRREKATVESQGASPIKSIVPSILTLGMIASLIIASFIEHGPYTNGIICVIFAIIAIIHGSISDRDISEVKKSFLSIDFQTIFFLTGLFVVIEGMKNVGLIDMLAALIVKAGGSGGLRLYVVVVLFSIAISAFVDNIPYVATMLPVIGALPTENQTVIYFGLIMGATLGGNLTPIGASANVAATGLLAKNGWYSTFSDFVKIGVPYTLAAAAAGAIFVWLVWA
ncbi:MAG: SLC13 family permease [Eubacteriales bacterium]|nr:SLC13 family permease [Eubacteriales bacterium]